MIKNSLILSGPYGREIDSKYRDPNDLRENITTLFFQGNGGSRFQGLQYTGPEGLSVISDGVELHGKSPGAPRMLHNLFTYEELDEVTYESSWNPMFLGMRVVTSLRNIWVASTAPPHYVNPKDVSIGGDRDVAHFVTNCEKMIRSFPDKHSVVFGCSRGAATVIVGVASLTEKLQKGLSLVIAEAPFDSITSVMEESAWFPKTEIWGLKYFTSYSDDQISPLEAIENFPLDVPIAFITSAQDKRVPPQCTNRLISALRKRGHKKVHHLHLEHSHHSVMSLQHPEDVEKYYLFLDTLYDMYCS